MRLQGIGHTGAEVGSRVDSGPDGRLTGCSRDGAELFAGHQQWDLNVLDTGAGPQALQGGLCGASGDPPGQPCLARSRTAEDHQMSAGVGDLVSSQVLANTATVGETGRDGQGALQVGHRQHGSTVVSWPLVDGDVIDQDGQVAHQVVLQPVTHLPLGGQSGGLLGHQVFEGLLVCRPVQHISHVRVSDQVLVEDHSDLFGDLLGLGPLLV